MEFVASEPNVELPRVDHWDSAAGGAPANCAVAIQRLGGLKSAFVGCVGQDPMGDKLKQILSQNGVDTSCLIRVSDKSSRTTLVFTAVHEDGHKELCFYRGADRCLTADQMSLTVNTIWDKARAFHYGSITMIDADGSRAQLQALQWARNKGVFITYDPNYRPTLWPDEATARRVMLDAFQYAHMAKISQEEFAMATGHHDLKEGTQAVLQRGVQLVIVSRGSEGAWASNGIFAVESEALDDVPIVETTGAGDGFMAAMITLLLPEFEKNGKSLKNIDPDIVKDALDYANIVGGLTCTKAGAIPALPTAQQIATYIEKRRASSTQSLDKILDSKQLAAMIDHTMLKPYLSENCDQENDIDKLCQEAMECHFGMVAVNPSSVGECCSLLRESSVRVGAAIGFPLGQTTTAVKVYETKDALEQGAREIDMVLNIRLLQNRQYQQVQDEIVRVVQTCRDFGKQKRVNITCKIILETCYLTKEQKFKACEICRHAGVDFVKTSTGFGSGGATVEDVKLLKELVGDDIGVKASGGIRDWSTARAMIGAGATRIGTSSGVKIMQEYNEYMNKQRSAPVERASPSSR